MAYGESNNQWCHVTLKGQTCDPNTLRKRYLENTGDAIVATAWLLVVRGPCSFYKATLKILHEKM